MKKSLLILLASAALSSLSGCKLSASVTSDALSISAIDGLSLPNYTLKDGVYTFPLSGSEKEGMKLSGSLSGGSIVIDPGSLSDNKSFEIDLAGVDISSPSAYPIYYGSKASKLIVNILSGSENTLTYSGSADKGAALFSENNLEVLGGGKLNLVTDKAGHGMRGDDLILSGAGTIDISAIHDGIHGKTLTASSYSGVTTIASCGSEAFDICDNDSTNNLYKGAVSFGSGTGTFTIGKCNDVFEVDNSFAIPAGVNISASSCLSEAVTNLNSSSITVDVLGSFTVNGSALTTFQVATKAS
jgi:hypothetical protein